MNKIDKTTVGVRFGRSFGTYDREAVVQREIARKLAEMIFRNCPPSLRSVMEIGCGTGFLTREILTNYSPKWYGLNDLVPEAVRKVWERMAKEGSFLRPGEVAQSSDAAESNTKFIPMPGDGETLVFPPGTDAVFSSSVFQWFEDLPSFFTKIASQLMPGGVFAFSIFGPDNLKQIKTLTGMGLEYPSLEQVESWLVRDFDILEIREEVTDCFFCCPMDVLRHLQQTGVTGTGEYTWTREKLGRFNEQYRNKYGTENGIPLTWHPMYAVGLKK